MSVFATRQRQIAPRRHGPAVEAYFPKRAVAEVLSGLFPVVRGAQRLQLVVGVRAASRQRGRVVYFVSLPEYPRFAAQNAEVFVPLEDAFPYASPWPAANALGQWRALDITDDLLSIRSLVRSAAAMNSTHTCL